MNFYFDEKSKELLETLANSIHDRGPNFFFTIAEVQIAKKWLENFAKEIKEDCVCI